MNKQSNLETEIEQSCPQPSEKACGRGVKNKRADVLLWCMLALALVLCVTVIGQVLGNGYVSVCGYSMFRVATGSMEPELPIGTLLVTKETPVEAIEKGEIVTFRSKQAGMLGVIITHRVVAVHEDENGVIFLETKGDANPYADGHFVDKTNLIGRLAIATGEGNVLAAVIQFLSSPAGFLACIVLPCLIGGIFLMRESVGSLKKEIEMIQDEIQEPQEESLNQSLENQMGQEAYSELCDKLRNELLEELKQSAAQIHTQEQPDEQRQ